MWGQQYCVKINGFLTQIGSMEELNNKKQHGPLMEVTNLHKADF